MYLDWGMTKILVPKLQLVAFQRVTIKAGELKFLDLVVTGERMAVWGDDGWTYVTGNLIFPW